MGLILLIVAVISNILIGWLGILYAVIKLVCLFRFKQLNNYFHDLAKSIDQTDNVLMRVLFNDILKKPNGYKFGNMDETISSCIGKNKHRNTLTKLGKLSDLLLDKLDPNHSLDAIDHTETTD